jgi:hypothetical protein
MSGKSIDAARETLLFAACLPAKSEAKAVLDLVKSRLPVESYAAVLAMRVGDKTLRELFESKTSP